ncbi:MAG: hypothetical protein ACK5NN_04240 [Sphingomonadaceae bacterium]
MEALVGEHVPLLTQRGDQQAAQLADGEQVQRPGSGKLERALEAAKREQGLGLANGLRKMG